MPFIQWFGAWLLFILLLVLFAQTKAGKTVVYYLLWLAVVYLLVSHASEIADMLAGAGITNQIPGSALSSGATQGEAPAQ